MKNKKKYTIIGIIVVMVVALGIWLFIRPKALGNINLSYSEAETSASTIMFKGEEGDRIRLSFTSNIKDGELDIIVYDSKGNVIKKLEKADRLETFVDLDNSDTYKLAAEYKNFVGSFKVKVSKEGSVALPFTIF